MPLNPQDIRDKLKAAYSALLTGQMDHFVSIMSDDVDLADPESTPWGGHWKGKALVQQQVPMIGMKMGLAGAEVTEILVDGHRAAVFVNMIQKNAAGEIQTVRVVECFKFNDAGLAVEIRPYFWDTKAMVDFMKSA